MTLCHADPSMLPAILDIENAAFTCPWSEKSFREAFDSEHITVYAVLAPDGSHRSLPIAYLSITITVYTTVSGKAYPRFNKADTMSPR